MGRHRTAQEKVELGERARAMRAAGLSRSRIQTELGIGDDLAGALLSGVPLPDSLRRPRAKDALRATAVELRQAGRTYDQIAVELGISKSTCSLWLRDVPVPASDDTWPLAPAAGSDLSVATGDEPPAPGDPDVEDDPRTVARELRRQGLLLRDIAAQLGTSTTTAYRWTHDLPVPQAARHGGDAAHTDMMRRRRWDRVQAEREAERQRVQAEHAARTGALDVRERELAAVVAYWCEGHKSKPWNRSEQVSFINSDPGLVRLFLAWLDDVGFPEEHRRFALSIHESADVGAATRWWAEVLHVDRARFGPAMLKRHNPSTVRKNTGATYVGCVVVRLVQCRELYQRIEGVWQGIMGGLPDGVAQDPSRVV